jgi:hexosaminidase
MRKLTSLFLILFICITAFSQSPIIPQPVVYTPANGTVTIGKTISIDPENLPDGIKEFLVKELIEVYEIQTVLSTPGKQVKFKKISNTPPDYYAITINDDILIQYSSETSCFYAVNSLLQLLEGDKDQYYFTKCFIQDYPKFQWRGLHLDVSRHFFTVDEVKRYIDLMSLYKFNTFHWHLTDDQGWRIEIKKYPKLTEIGAWRDSTVNDHYTTNPRTYMFEKYGGFYTQEEIKEVVAYASERYITVVPEIEMPGHARAALAAYPEYSCTGQQQEVPGLWGVFDDIFCSHESSFDFLKDILDEVLVLFPSEYIHIGGDEAPKARWKKCKKCQAVIRENGFKDEHELQSYFIGRIDDYLTKKGRKLIGWDEILEGGLSPNATVMSWRGFEGGIEAAKQKHFVVMSPGSHCYFDHYQSTNPNEPLAIGGFTSIQKVYDFNPIPAGFTEQEAFYILGGQANLWTEYIPDMKQLEYMTYPRALALSQVLWCQKKPAYVDFEKSLVNYHLKNLQRYNVNYSRALFYPEMEISKKLDGLNIHFKAAEKDYHFDLFTKSDEKVGTMNGGQVVGKTDSLYFERSKGDKEVNYSFKLTSEYDPTPTNFKLKVHPAIGLPVELITKPNDRYKGKGGFTLVDGIKGTRPWKGNEWLGFDTNRIELIIDLQKQSQIKAVKMGFLLDESSWIHLPSSVEILYSKNKKKWKKISHQDPMDPIKITEDFSRHFFNKGQYVKIVVNSVDKIPVGLPGEGNQPWTFIDELIIFFE